MLVFVVQVLTELIYDKNCWYLVDRIRVPQFDLGRLLFPR